MPSDIDAVSAEHIEAYLADEVATKAAATAHQRYRGLKQLFAWLTSQGDIARDPMATLRPPIIPARHVDTVEIEDFRRMLKTCDRDHLIDVRDEALLRCLWDTGGRLSEVTGLKVADVDFPQQVVRLFGKGRRERHVAIAASTGSSIHRYLRRRAKISQQNSPWLWTGQKGPMSPSGVRQMVWRRSDLAGLEHRVHPHQLRHSKADAWLAADGSERGLMKQMGWKSPMMVHRYAANVAERRSIEEAKRGTFLSDLATPSGRHRKRLPAGLLQHPDQHRPKRPAGGAGSTSLSRRRSRRRSPQPRGPRSSPGR